MKESLEAALRRKMMDAQFFMIRYETEFTPCTGITAVTRQERRHFLRGVMIAPWCPNLIRQEEQDPVKTGQVKLLDWTLDVLGINCRVYTTTDKYVPTVFLEVEGRFLGSETPYDVPIQELKVDTLYFGLAVEALLRSIPATKHQFVWGADWETVPALTRVRNRHYIALTVHNTFDECLADAKGEFEDQYSIFGEWSYHHYSAKTALEIGLEVADAVTTVNRGFAMGIRCEPLQKDIMANHIQHLTSRVVGINNAAFSPLDSTLLPLKKSLETDLKAGIKDLLNIKSTAMKALKKELPDLGTDNKVVFVTMGRRVSQKQHDVLVESVRGILKQEPDYPIFVFFATVHGSNGSADRLDRMKQLQEEFPSNVYCTDGRLSYYKTLMLAADFNCMPSLYEPHGGAFEGIVIPVARAVDGLAEQICARKPRGQAQQLNDLWHSPAEKPSGIVYRETYKLNANQMRTELNALLVQSPSPHNSIFAAMKDALIQAIRDAVDLRLNHEQEYAELVLSALQKQEHSGWSLNLGGMLALIEQARIKREL